MDIHQPLDVKIQIVSGLFKPEYMPRYATVGSAGMDLHACIAEPILLAPSTRVRVSTGVALQMPHSNVVGLVYARSGLAWRKGIGLPNGVGVIDSDYTGELQVLLTNFSNESVEIQPGDRIAQIVFAPIHLANFSLTDALEVTERGQNGFGSTGV